MEYISEQKYLIISPRKLRPIVEIIKKLKPSQALEKVSFIKKRGSEYLYKVIKSAIANAYQKGSSAEKLIFKEIQIMEGPRLKRGRPVSRGRWHPIKKRMSHIRVVLIEQNSKLQMSNAKLKQQDKVTKTKKKGVKKDVTKN